VLQNVAMFGSVFPLIERVNEGFVLGKSLRLTTNKLDFKLFCCLSWGCSPPIFGGDTRNASVRGRWRMCLSVMLVMCRLRRVCVCVCMRMCVCEQNARCRRRRMVVRLINHPKSRIFRLGSSLYTYMLYMSAIILVFGSQMPHIHLIRSCTTKIE